VLQQVLLKEFPAHFTDFLIVDRLIEHMSFETVTEAALALAAGDSSQVFIIIQAKKYLQGDVLNAKSLQNKLQAINASNDTPKEEEIDNLRMSIKNQKGLQDLFQKDDESECKVFRLPISSAVEV
jgi:hypothetical protein